MIPYCESRLQEWATWSHTRADGAWHSYHQFNYEEREVIEPQHIVRVPVHARCLETEASAGCGSKTADVRTA